MDASAIETIQKTALEAARANRLDTACPAVILDGRIESIENLQAGRTRYRGHLTTSSLHDFIEYVNAAPEGTGFITPEDMHARVYFNLGDTDSPGHGDWFATLNLKRQPAYQAMLDVNGKLLDQRGLIEFAEDWAPHITAMDADHQDIPIGKALAAIRKLTIKASREASYTEKEFGAKRSALEDIEASSKEGLPWAFGFKVEPYEGFVEKSFTLRLAVLTGDEKPKLKLRVIALDSAIAAIAAEFQKKLLSGVADGVSLYLGDFTP